MSTASTVKVYFTLCDIRGEGNCNKPVYVELNRNYALYDDDIIKRERERFFSDENGYVEMNLINTEKMQNDTGSSIYYKLEIPDVKYKRDFTIPSNISSSLLFDLSGITC